MIMKGGYIPAAAAYKQPRKHEIAKLLKEFRMWLSYNNQEEVLLFPVNPSQIEITGGNDTSTYEISKLGQIASIKSPKLRTFSFESEFPKQSIHYQVWEEILAPQYCIERIEKWMTKKRPLRFTMVGDMFNLNFPVTIKNFTYSQEAGHDCVYFKLDLEEYRFYAARRVIPNANRQPGK